MIPRRFAGPVRSSAPAGTALQVLVGDRRVPATALPWAILLRVHLAGLRIFVARS